MTLPHKSAWKRVLVRVRGPSRENVAVLDWVTGSYETYVFDPFQVSFTFVSTPFWQKGLIFLNIEIYSIIDLGVFQKVRCFQNAAQVHERQEVLNLPVRSISKKVFRTCAAFHGFWWERWLDDHMSEKSENLRWSFAENLLQIVWKLSEQILGLILSAGTRFAQGTERATAPSISAWRKAFAQLQLGSE